MLSTAQAQTTTGPHAASYIPYSQVQTRANNLASLTKPSPAAQSEFIPGGNYALGALRFPGTRGGAWVAPYLGKGKYTFQWTVVITGQGTVYEGNTATPSFSSIALEVTDATCSSNVSSSIYPYGSNYYYPLLSLPGKKSPFGAYNEGRTVFKTHMGFITPMQGILEMRTTPFYYNGGVDPVMPADRNSYMKIQDVYGGMHKYGNWINSTHVGTTMQIKATIDDTFHNANYKHFVMRDWAYETSTETEASGPGTDIDIRTVTSFVITQFTSTDPPPLTGKLSKESQLLQGYKGKINLSYLLK